MTIDIAIGWLLTLVVAYVLGCVHGRRGD